MRYLSKGRLLAGGFGLLACATVTPLAATETEAVTLPLVSARAEASVARGWQLESEVIQQTRATHPQELLAQVPGVNITKGGGQEHLLALRGPLWTGPGGCGELLLAEDGLPIRPLGFCNANGLIELQHEQASGLRVLNGPQAAAIYGASGLHGVIDLQSFALKPEGRISVEGGPYDFGRINWLHATDNAGIAITAQSDNGYVDDAGTELYKASGKWRVDLSEQWQLTHNVSTVHLEQKSLAYLVGENSYRDNHRRRDNSAPDAFRDLDAWRYSANFLRTQDNRQTEITPYWRRSTMHFSQHFLFPASTEKNGQHSGGLFAQHTEQTHFGQWQLGAQIEQASTYLKEWQTLPATRTSPQGVHYDYNVQSRAGSVWSAVDWQLSSAWLLQAGLRADWLNYDYDNKTGSGALGKYLRPADTQDSFRILSPRLGIQYTDRGNRQWYASVSRSGRPPQSTELYRLQGNQANDEIDSVRARQVEVGVRVAGSLAAIDWHSQLAVYRMRKYQVIIRNAENVFESSAKTEHEGGELALTAEYGNWYSRLAFNYAEHRYGSDVFDKSTSVKGNIIDSAPRIQGALELGFNAADWRVALEWLHADSYNLDPNAEFIYKGHDLVNLRGQWQVTENVSLFGRLMNIADVDYAERADVTGGGTIEPRYFVGSPRALYLGFEWSYQ